MRFKEKGIYQRSKCDVSLNRVQTFAAPSPVNFSFKRIWGFLLCLLKQSKSPLPPVAGMAQATSARGQQRVNRGGSRPPTPILHPKAAPDTGPK